jgi:hypothetical protein
MVQTQSDFGRAPAGWYPDPIGLPQMRWWDSIGWTQDVAEARQPMVMRETAEKRFAWADDELPTRRERREQRRREREAEKHGGMDKWRPATETLLQLEAPVPSALTEAPAQSRPEAPAAPTAADLRPEAGTPTRRPDPLDTPDDFDRVPETAESDFSRFFDWAPEQEPELAFASFTSTVDAAFGRSATAVAPLHTAPPSQVATQQPALPPLPPVPPLPAAPSQVSTGPVWVIALIPLVQLVLSLLLVTGAMDWTGSAQLLAAIWLLPYPIVLVLALFDTWLLQRAGYHRPALWAFALLGTPVYLLVRAMRTSRESGRGLTPLITWTVLVFLQAGSLLAVPGMAIATLPNMFSAQVEQSIASDASILGAHLTVDCPAIPPTHLGAQFTCTAVGDSQSTYPVTVSLQRLNGWIDWRVDDWGMPAQVR